MKAMRLKLSRMGVRLRRFGFKPLALTLLFFVFSISLAPVLPASEIKTADAIDCDIQQNDCTKELPGCLVTLDITPKPVKAMTDLLFRVTLSGRAPEGFPYIDLGMPGMNMGPNRVKLRQAGKTTYEGTGIIVRCPSGKTIWRATVTIPGTGVVEFVFNVVY